MKCCVSTDVGTWTNWLTFEPDPDHIPDAGTGLLSPISYRLWNFAALPRLPASCAATRNFTSGNPTYTCWQRAARANRGFKMVLFTACRKTFVGGKCALPSALLVDHLLVTGWRRHVSLFTSGLAKNEVIFAQQNLISNGLTDLMHAKSIGEFRLILDSAIIIKLLLSLWKPRSWFQADFKTI